MNEQIIQLQLLAHMLRDPLQLKTNPGRLGLIWIFESWPDVPPLYSIRFRVPAIVSKFTLFTRKIILCLHLKWAWITLLVTSYPWWPNIKAACVNFNTMVQCWQNIHSLQRRPTYEFSAKNFRDVPAYWALSAHYSNYIPERAALGMRSNLVLYNESSLALNAGAHYWNHAVQTPARRLSLVARLVDLYSSKAQRVKRMKVIYPRTLAKNVMEIENIVSCFGQGFESRELCFISNLTERVLLR